MTETPHTPLLPCPVCGSAPKWRGSQSDYRVGIYRLQCIGETHLFQSYGATEEICIAAWNTRATPLPTTANNPETDAHRDLVEALRFYLAGCTNEECEYCIRARAALTKAEVTQ